jgi:hypothetical protein
MKIAKWSLDLHKSAPSGKNAVVKEEALQTFIDVEDYDGFRSNSKLVSPAQKDGSQDMTNYFSNNKTIEELEKEI